MKDKKHTGSFYTPQLLANFITKRVLSFKSDFRTILEPSAGDGAFIKSILESTHPTIQNLDITVIEKDHKELLKINTLFAKYEKRKIKHNALAGDFLRLYKTLNYKFDIILGNPPYIKKNRMAGFQILESKKIFKELSLSGQVNNIWSSFLLCCISLLKEDGIISFVLPTELLQVKFSNEIRDLLKRTFERIEIFTFNDLLFESLGQDTIVLIGFRKSNNKGIYYSNIKNIEDFEINNYALKKNDLLDSNKLKWSHHSLKREEIELIFKIKESLSPVETFCESRPGTVTAANDYFIVNQETVEEFSLEKLVKPIIQKGMYVNGKVEFDLDDFEFLKKKGLPSYLICFHDKPIARQAKIYQTYIRKAYVRDIHTRYKMSKRVRWYIIPNIVKPADAFFFKRSHLYPKLIKNSANIFVTDSAYSIKMKDDFNVDSLIYSFYNSLTLIFAELEGRYYGGGVLELTPSEFKGLPIPYVNVDSKTFVDFKSRFQTKQNIEEILKEGDKIILGGKYGISNRDIMKLRQIRNKLLKKRTGKILRRTTYLENEKSLLTPQSLSE